MEQNIKEIVLRLLNKHLGKEDKIQSLELAELDAHVMSSYFTKGSDDYTNYYMAACWLENKKEEFKSIKNVNNWWETKTYTDKTFLSGSILGKYNPKTLCFNEVNQIYIQYKNQESLS